MKIVGVLYLEAIRILKKKGFKPLRTIHITYVPDEEIGGVDGMYMFTKSPEFVKLNVGLVIDEGIHPCNFINLGIACMDNAYKLFYDERTPWYLFFHIYSYVGMLGLKQWEILDMEVNLLKISLLINWFISSMIFLYRSLSSLSLISSDQNKRIA